MGRQSSVTCPNLEGSTDSGCNSPEESACNSFDWKSVQLRLLVLICRKNSSHTLTLSRRCVSEPSLTGALIEVDSDARESNGKATS